MLHKIISADNKKIEVECLGCALVKGEIETVGGFAMETNLFTVSQDFEIPIPGFLILASKRHFRSVAELSEAEQNELTNILIKTRKSMLDLLEIKEVTIIQEEKTENSHFHIWLFPWYDWMNTIGRDLGSIKRIMEYSRNNLKTEDNLLKVKEASDKIRNALTQTSL